MGLVLISHSGKIAEGLRDMVAQVAGDDVPVATAGGTEDGRLGNQRARPSPRPSGRRLERGRGRQRVVLLDLGSAALSLELALEELDADDRARVRDQRGAARRGGGPRGRPGEHRARRSTKSPTAAEGAATMPKRRGPDDGRSDLSPSSTPSGLHARPAARFVQAASRFASSDRDPHGRREADAKSLIAPARPDDPPGASRSRSSPTAPTPTRRSCPRRRARPPTSRRPSTPDPAGRERPDRRTRARGGRRMSSPTLVAEADGRGHRHRDPGVHRRGLRAADRVPDRAATRSAARSSSTISFAFAFAIFAAVYCGRPHQRLPHQSGRDDRPARDPQDRRPDRGRATSSRSSSGPSSARP